MQHGLKKRQSIGLVLTAVLLLLFFVVISVSYHVEQVTQDSILGRSVEEGVPLSTETLDKTKDCQASAIIVLGASVIDENTPSNILKARLDVAVELYQQGVAPKILLSGDNGEMSYNEIVTMFNYAKAKGVPEQDIFCDPKGYNTMDSMARAKQVFGIDKGIVVTQGFHISRAIYIGEEAGMDVCGIASDQVGPKEAKKSNIMLMIREVFARNKDYWRLEILGVPEYGDEKISTEGDGTVTHGK